MPGMKGDLVNQQGINAMNGGRYGKLTWDVCYELGRFSWLTWNICQKWREIHLHGKMTWDI